MQAVKGLGLDRYDRKARLQPALLMLLPALLLPPLWMPEVRTPFGGAVFTALSAAVLTLLMSWVRQRGRSVQEGLVSRLGGMPSTIILRHGDPRVAQPTRDRVHAHLRKQGLQVPDAAQQASDLSTADAAYRSCVDWLLERTRKDKLLQDENMEYGFRRNLLGIKAPAIGVLLSCLAIDLAAVALRETITPTQQTAALLLAAAYLCGLAAWVFVVNLRFVEDSSWAYSQRLMMIAEST